jgi:hypothetical protein|tara:strand:- start:5760 stop:6089 length:330 start_codon:yes stop_codon:yes gene_type:complete
MAKLSPFYKKIIFLLGIVLIALIYSGLRFANSYKLKEGNTNHDSGDPAHDHLTKLTETTDSSNLEETGLYLGDVQLMRDKTGTSLGQEIESSSSGERTAAGVEVGGGGV